MLRSFLVVPSRPQPYEVCLPLLLALWLNPAFGEVLTGKVVGVSDGDTITVLDAGKTQHKIRLAGIDAPEKAQAFGQRAKEHRSDLVFGKQVVVATPRPINTAD